MINPHQIEQMQRQGRNVVQIGGHSKHQIVPKEIRPKPPSAQRITKTSTLTKTGGYDTANIQGNIHNT